MNCVPPFSRLFVTALLAAVVLSGCGVPASESADRGDEPEYDLRYTLRVDPGASAIEVSMTLRQPRNLVRELSFATNSSISDLAGDGDVMHTGDRLTWLPPARGGELSWRVAVRHERGSGSYDALLTANWGVFRAEDVIPRARTRTLKGAWSNTTMRFELPPGWSAITEYSAAKPIIDVDRPERRFDQPTGWVAVGNLGVRRETIAGVRVVVAAPQGHAVRRMDTLALLNWTLPEVLDLLPESMTRLTIVSAGDPMWRGGLSAPASLFMHAERPLISENGTSSLLHEVMHTALAIRADDGFDWISEGLAEYYSIEVLRRGRAISEQRAERALRQQATWAERSDTLCAAASTGAITARAVTVFQALNREIQRASDGAHDLDSLLSAIAGKRVNLDVLQTVAEQLTGSIPDTLHIDNLPGCRTIASASPQAE